MNTDRRQFLSCALGGSISMALSASVLAKDGYELIDPTQNTATKDAVEVIEFFWLGCPHCYAFESTISQWKKSKPDNVTLVREAPPLNPSWEEHSRGFYAAGLMGKEDAFVDAMFHAIHEEGQPMRKPNHIANLALTIGLNDEKFLQTMQSFAVKTKLNRAVQLAKGASISSVPSIVINGKYRTSARLAGGHAGMIDVINQTVSIEKQSMGLD